MYAIRSYYAFIDIVMPSTYIANAENVLYEMAQKWLAFYSQLRVKYTLSLDHRYIRDNAINLKIGDLLTIVDTALGINKQIRITTLSQSIDGSSVTAEISNYLEERLEKKLQASLNDTIQQLTEARSAATAAGMGVTQLAEELSNYNPSFDKISGLPTDNDALKDYLDRIGDTSYA